MVFVINKLKYDTDKMVLVSEKCSYAYNTYFLNSKIKYVGENVKLWKSAKGNWFLTYEDYFENKYGKVMDKNEVEELLLKYDLEKYEEIFGELEEAKEIFEKLITVKKERSDA